MSTACWQSSAALLRSFFIHVRTYSWHLLFWGQRKNAEKRLRVSLVSSGTGQVLHEVQVALAPSGSGRGFGFQSYATCSHCMQSRHDRRSVWKRDSQGVHGFSLAGQPDCAIADVHCLQHEPKLAALTTQGKAAWGCLVRCLCAVDKFQNASDTVQSCSAVHFRMKACILLGVSFLVCMLRPCGCWAHKGGAGHCGPTRWLSQPCSRTARAASHASSAVQRC